MAICVEQMCGLSSRDAGTAMARAFAAQGAQCAVIPVGLSGGGAAAAIADILDAPLDALVVTDDGTAELAVAGRRGMLLVNPRTDQELFEAGSALVGDAVAAALQSYPQIHDLIIDVGACTWHDGGAGFLGALGAGADVALDSGVSALGGLGVVDLRPALGLVGDRNLVLVGTNDEVDSPLTGLRGITSRLGTRDDLSLERQLGLDTALQHLVDACRRAGGRASGISRGGAAHGGLGFAVLTLGGRVQRGLEVCSELTGLPDTLRRADLIVTGCDELDFGRWDRTVVLEVAGMVHAETPVVAVARENHITAREVRSQLIEAAHSLRVEPARSPGEAERLRVMDDITRAASSVAASWFPTAPGPSRRP